MNTHEMAAAETQPIGALGQTHIAFCMMKERTKELFNDKTKGPMDEVMNLATTTSRFDGLAAHLLRAVVLQYAGEFDDIERAEALDRYVDVNKVRLPDWQGALLSHMAADAALQLDDHASPLRIAVPQNLPDGAVGDTLVYRVLGMKWGVANVDEWVATAKARGIDPLSDVADAERPTSLRIWAASARGAMHPDLSTQQEEDTKERLQGLTTCDNVERLAVEDQDSPEKCSLDSTFAYYLSSVWGIK